MSLYEIMSMFAEIERQSKNKPDVSDDEWADYQETLRDMAERDPSVSLH